jgi:hypothetical protein
VASGLNRESEDNLKNSFSADYRTFILNQDTSLYDAMNIGLDVAIGDAIIFMNSGDVFLDSKSCRLISESFKTKRCLAFRTIQSYGDSGFVRPKLSKLSLLERNPAHQGFVAPLPEAKGVKYNLEYTVAADLHWMRELIKRHGVVVKPEVISRFELGGISNVPTITSIRIKWRESKLSIPFFKILLKSFLYRVLGPKAFYRVVFFVKYDYKKSLY